jgi:NADH-quinone oxidoreductase subunit N
MTLSLFIPETMLSALSVLLLSLTLVKKEQVSKFLNPLMTFSGLLLLAGCLWALKADGSLFYSTYKIDLLSQGFKLMIATGLFFTFLVSKETLSIARSLRVEYFLFLSTAALGMMMMTSAADILTLYISMELSAYSLYLLASLRQDKSNAEAGVKYLILGAAASGIFLWGFSLVAGISGSLSLIEISKKAPQFVSQPVFVIGLALASMAFLFKLSSVPVHFWAPDVYEKASTQVTAFIATASKVTAVAILIRIFLWMGVAPNFVAVLVALSFLSMTLGNAVALVQKDVKRLLAYSSIAQAGYILVGLLAGSLEGYSSVYFYALAYLVMNAGAFLVVLCVAKTAADDNPQISHFNGLAERSPFLGLVLLLSLLSLAGIPPLIGFTGKWILFSAAMEKGHWFLVLWGVLNSVVSLFYYLTLVKHAYLEKPSMSSPILLPIPIKILGFLILAMLVLVGIFPNPVISFSQNAVQMAASF